MGKNTKQETRTRKECMWEVERHLDFRLSVPVNLENVLRIIPTGAGSAPELNLHQVNSDEAHQIERFCSAMDLTESSAIVLRNIETGAYRIIRPKDSSRYFESGRKNTQGRVRNKLRHNKGGHGIFLTLTIAPRQMTRQQAWLRIGDMMSKFMERLNKHRQRKMTALNKERPKDKQRKYRRLTYVWTLEEQPGTGYPHIHMFFPWLKWLEYDEVLKDLWGFGMIQLQSGHANISKYIVKYITKMEGWSLLGLSYLWEHKRRLYSFTRKFSIPGQKKEPEYELIGAFNKVKGFGIYTDGKGYSWVGQLCYEDLFDVGKGGVFENPGAAEYMKEVLWTEEVKPVGRILDMDGARAAGDIMARLKVDRAYRNGKSIREGAGKAQGYVPGTIAEGQESFKYWELREGAC